MSDRQKSAKDLAWDRERLKHRHEVEALQKDIAYWKSCEECALAQRDYAKSIVEEQAEQIKVLTDMVGMDIQTLNQHLRATKKAAETAKRFEELDKLLSLNIGIDYGSGSSLSGGMPFYKHPSSDREHLMPVTSVADAGTIKGDMITVEPTPLK